MNPALIATLIIVAGAAGLFVWIVLACRTPKSRHWHERNKEAIVKNLPSFEVYSAKNQRSRALAAANKR